MDPIEQALQRTLVLKCQLGDRRALEELFLRHNRALGYYLRRKRSDRALRDDSGLERHRNDCVGWTKRQRC